MGGSTAGSASTPMMGESVGFISIICLCLLCFLSIRGTGDNLVGLEGTSGAVDNAGLDGSTTSVVGTFSLLLLYASVFSLEMSTEFLGSKCSFSGDCMEKGFVLWTRCEARRRILSLVVNTVR